jgi:hypothetical protein
MKSNVCNGETTMKTPSDNDFSADDSQVSSHNSFRVHQYLEGLMNADDEATFLSELSSNAALQRELALQRFVHVRLQQLASVGTTPTANDATTIFNALGLTYTDSTLQEMQIAEDTNNILVAPLLTAPAFIGKITEIAMSFDAVRRVVARFSRLLLPRTVKVVSWQGFLAMPFVTVLTGFVLAVSVSDGQREGGRVGAHHSDVIPPKPLRVFTPLVKGGLLSSRTMARSDATHDKSLLPPLTRAGLLRSQTVASSDAVYDQSPLPPLTRGVKTLNSFRVGGFGGITSKAASLLAVAQNKTNERYEARNRNYTAEDAMNPSITSPNDILPIPEKVVDNTQTTSSETKQASPKPHLQPSADNAPTKPKLQEFDSPIQLSARISFADMAGTTAWSNIMLGVQYALSPAQTIGFEGGMQTFQEQKTTVPEVATVGKPPAIRQLSSAGIFYRLSFPQFSAMDGHLVPFVQLGLGAAGKEGMGNCAGGLRLKTSIGFAMTVTAEYTQPLTNTLQSRFTVGCGINILLPK